MSGKPPFRLPRTEARRALTPRPSVIVSAADEEKHVTKESTSTCDWQHFGVWSEVDCNIQSRHCGGMVRHR